MRILLRIVAVNESTLDLPNVMGQSLVLRVEVHAVSELVLLIVQSELLVVGSMASLLSWRTRPEEYLMQDWSGLRVRSHACTD